MLYRKSKKYNRRTAPSWKKPVFILITTVAIAAAAAFVLAQTGTFPFKKEAGQQEATRTTADSATKGEGGSSNSPGVDTPESQDGTWSSDNKDPENSSDQPVIGKLKAPDGNFVSAHHVSLSANSPLQSSCVTTPGATCQVQFTKDGKTKSLEAKKTDAGGGAYWTWELNDAGLTVGSWKVQLKATLGSESSTAYDALPLEISS